MNRQLRDTDKTEELDAAAQAAYDKALDTEDAEDLAAWTEERDRQLAEQPACRHSAPGYDSAHTVDSSDVIWCSLCGALGEWVNEADPGHQIDLPVDWGGDPGLERGPGYSWTLPQLLIEHPALRALAEKEEKKDASEGTD